jgi:hypothetical protein
MQTNNIMVDAMKSGTNVTFPPKMELVSQLNTESLAGVARALPHPFAAFMPSPLSPNSFHLLTTT